MGPLAVMAARHKAHRLGRGAARYTNLCRLERCRRPVGYGRSASAVAQEVIVPRGVLLSDKSTCGYVVPVAVEDIGFNQAIAAVYVDAVSLMLVLAAVDVAVMYPGPTGRWCVFGEYSRIRPSVDLTVVDFKAAVACGSKSTWVLDADQEMALAVAFRSFVKTLSHEL